MVLNTFALAAASSNWNQFPPSPIAPTGKTSFPFPCRARVRSGRRSLAKLLLTRVRVDVNTERSINGMPSRRVRRLHRFGADTFDEPGYQRRGLVRSGGVDLREDESDEQVPWAIRNTTGTGSIARPAAPTVQAPCRNRRHDRWTAQAQSLRSRRLAIVQSGAVGRHGGVGCSVRITQSTSPRRRRHAAPSG